MSVPVGYKATEVGVIPNDWEVANLGSIGRFKNGINKPKDAFGSGDPFVNLMDVFGVGKICSTAHLGLIASNDADRSMYDLKTGDVLFIRSSVKPSGVGLTTVVSQDLPRTVYSGFLLRFRDQGQLTTGFKEHCFHQESFRTRIIANSTVSANTNINQSALKALVIGYPRTTAEQSAIAEALSDVDAAIAAQEAVIAKKRALKTATMQALLSGTRRLPGFSGEWGATTLKQICDFITKGATPTTYGFTWQSSGVLFLRSECVSETGLDLTQSMFICDDAHRMMQRSAVANGDILVTITGNVGRVVRYVGSKAANLNQHIARIRISSSDVSPDYIYHYLNQPEVRRMYNQITTGQAYPQLSLVQVRNTTIPLPTYDEQCEIAAYLSDMDCEIIEQESILTKLRHLKTGMMQQLLTGKIRLI